jgi:small subunit ribosomal protein S5
MAEEQKQTTSPAPQVPAPGAQDNRGRRFGRGGDEGGFRKNPRRFGRGEAKTKPEFDQKIIDIRRVTRVVAGGRRFSFSVALVAGDRKGGVGVGIGKAGDTSLAIEKALKNAKKNLIRVPVTKGMSIPYEVSAKFAASRVTMSPTPGRGVVAGSSIRSVIELAGLKDVGAKLRSGSKNRLNNARVAIEALRSLTPHRRVIRAKLAAAKK